MSIAFTQRPPDYWSEVPSGASDFEFVYTSAIDYYWLFTNATVPAGTSFLEVTPTPPELGALSEQMDSSLLQSVFGWIISTAQPIRATSQFSFSTLETMSFLVVPTHTRQAQAQERSLYQGRCRSPAWISTGCALCSTPQAQKCLCGFSRSNGPMSSTGCVFPAPMIIGQSLTFTMDFRMRRIGAIRSAHGLFTPESTISDSYIEFDYSAIVEPPVNASFYFKIPNPSGFQTKLDAIHSAGRHLRAQGKPARGNRDAWNGVAGIPGRDRPCCKSIS